MRDRQAARLAAAVALPVALVAGALTYRTLSATRAAPAASAPPPARTAPVEMPAPSLADADVPVCRAFIANLPGQIGSLRRRPVTAGIEQNAAYGDPPVTVSCGQTPPPMPPDADIYPLNGTCWWTYDKPDAAGKRPDPTVWRSVDRRVPIAVAFPAAYRNQGEGQLLLDLRDTLVAWVPSLPRPPSYCALPSTAPS